MQDTVLAPLTALPAPLRAAGLLPLFPREQRWEAREAALLLDSEGRITDANAAAATLLGRRASALEGKDISQLVPDLPLSRTTPGYNLAYAAFHAGAPGWLAHTALTARGEFMPIELSLASVRVHGVRVIALTLRPTIGTPRLAA